MSQRKLQFASLLRRNKARICDCHNISVQANLDIVLVGVTPFHERLLASPHAKLGLVRGGIRKWAIKIRPMSFRSVQVRKYLGIEFVIVAHELDAERNTCHVDPIRPISQNVVAGLRELELMVIATNCQSAKCAEGPRYGKRLAYQRSIGPFLGNNPLNCRSTWQEHSRQCVVRILKFQSAGRVPDSNSSQYRCVFHHRSRFLCS